MAAARPGGLLWEFAPRGMEADAVAAHGWAHVEATLKGWDVELCIFAAAHVAVSPDGAAVPEAIWRRLLDVLRYTEDSWILLEVVLRAFQVHLPHVPQTLRDQLQPLAVRLYTECVFRNVRQAAEVLWRVCPSPSRGLSTAVAAIAHRHRFATGRQTVKLRPHLGTC